MNTTAKTEEIKSARINLRFKPETRSKAEELAASENRSLNNWLETVIERVYAEEMRSRRATHDQH